MVKIIYASFVFLFFYCCSSTHLLVISNNLDLPLLTMRRTSCYGTCPQYTISIYSDGIVKYEGEMFVDKIGCFHSHISIDLVEKIKSKLHILDFFSLKNEYNAPMTDVPSVILSVDISGKKHQVIDRFNGPIEIKLFQNFIDSISNSLMKWENCK